MTVLGPAADPSTGWPAGTLPSVTAIVCTRDRPVLLRRAVASIFAQDYPGQVECVVVLDRCEQEIELPDAPPGRTVVILKNERRPGLAGARNTGLQSAGGELVGFCDDDDEWLPAKLSAQVEVMRRHPEAALCATGITIVTADERVVRTPPAHVTLTDLLRSRVAEIHPSSFLMRKADLSAAGAVDEQVPHSYGEDYELMLRLARRGPLLCVPEALTVVHWDRLSYFNARWDSVSEGLSYILPKFPEFADDRVGRARVRGQVAFAHAAARRRGQAARWALATLRDDPRQLRGYGALAVASGLVRPESLLERVNAQGRGL